VGNFLRYQLDTEIKGANATTYDGVVKVVVGVLSVVACTYFSEKRSEYVHRNAEELQNAKVAEEVFHEKEEVFLGPGPANCERKCRG
jgi:hypothetical protein